MSNKILVLNHSAEVLSLINDILEEEGYQCNTGAEVGETIDMIASHEPDLIILDHIFGGNLAGWELIQTLKLHKNTAHIPIILCTAAVNIVNELEPQLKAKNIKVVLKPFDIDELVQAVAESIGHP